jgi:Holliday junction DNA helicase RuvA
MFEYIKGTISEKSPGVCVLDVHGVGYYIEIPASTFTRLGGEGSDARLLIHYLVREDAHKLFGFATESERDAFRKLIGISKIGPKVALAILSNMSIRDLAYASLSGDATRLKAISGVGAKTAQRLVIELKGKFSIEGLDENADLAVDDEGGAGKQVGVEREAYTAMVSLGYTEAQVVKSLARVKETLDGGEAAVEEWIRRALQVI